MKLKLFAKGLFPKELPPNFTAEACGKVMRSWAAPTDSELRKFVSLPGRHSLARIGGTRRTLAMPNPIAHFQLVSVLDAGKPQIDSQIKSSRWSASIPRYQGAKERAVVPRSPLGDLPLLRAKNRALGRVTLLADISDFYRSIYTHSIPWALHGKKTAKDQKHNMALLGNRIDAAIRGGQSQQTKGIPIGPDSSLVIAELIGSAIDRELSVRINPVSAFRYYDDYEFVFEARSDAETALAHLQQILSSYELDLNPNKTAIRELPAPSEYSWILRIRDYEFGPGRASTQRVIGFFDEVFELQHRQPNSYVIGYAISRLEKARFRSESWTLIEQLLSQAVLAEPSAIPQFARFLVAQAAVHNRYPTRSLLQNLVNKVISTGVPLGHSSEVVWALWTAIAFKLSIERHVNGKLTNSRDPAVILLALDADERGRFKQRLDRTQWTSLMTSQSLTDEHWLVAYEANIRNWIPNAVGDHVGADPRFSLLKAADVHFYIPKFDVSRRLLARLSPRRGKSYGDSDDDGAPDPDDDEIDDDGDEVDDDDDIDPKDVDF